MTDTGHRTDTGDGTCRRCNAELLWAWLLGKRTRVPVDPAPALDDDPTAELAITRDHLGRLRARQLEPDERPAGLERRAHHHHATCRVLVEARQAAESLRQARRSAPSFADPEALADARQRQADRLAELVDGDHESRPAKRARR